VISNQPGCCGFCDRRLSLKTVFVASLVSGKRWIATCPDCGASNQMSFLVNGLLTCVSLLAAGVLAGAISDGGKSIFIFCLAALLIFSALRGALTYTWLHFGKLRGTTI